MGVGKEWFARDGSAANRAPDSEFRSQKIMVLQH